MLAALGISLGYDIAHMRSDSYDTSVSAFICFISLIGTYVWCAVFLKTEPNLTRIALLIATLTFGGLGFSIIVMSLLDM
jgi:hypothetical protein